MTGLEIAKERLRIPELWERRGWPGKPGRTCPVPYREDKRPSGSVFRDGRLFHDFGDGQTLDAPALLAKVEDLDLRAACLVFATLAGVQAGPVADFAPPRPPRRVSEEARTKPTLPPLRDPTADEIEAIAEQRGIRPGGCELARLLGFLKVTIWRGLPVWTVTDRTRWAAQYRRLDGQPFEIRGAAAKTITARGSWASWPVGIAEAAERGVRRVVICEGSTDFLAAFSLIWEEKGEAEVQPVAMLGAGGAIPEEAIPLFRAIPEVLIVPDLDRAGAAAAFRWEHQLLDANVAACCLDLSGLFRRDGRPVADLNDVCRMEAAELARLRPLLSF
jgi:hypothetical protein